MNSARRHNHRKLKACDCTKPARHLLLEELSAQRVIRRVRQEVDGGTPQFRVSVRIRVASCSAQERKGERGQRHPKRLGRDEERNLLGRSQIVVCHAWECMHKLEPAASNSTGLVGTDESCGFGCGCLRRRKCPVSHKSVLGKTLDRPWPNLSLASNRPRVLHEEGRLQDPGAFALKAVQQHLPRDILLEEGLVAADCHLNHETLDAVLVQDPIAACPKPSIVVKACRVLLQCDNTPLPLSDRPIQHTVEAVVELEALLLFCTTRPCACMA
mmetsp:Transcript_11433/g.28408  ORF Transcript_11433/g.28408 Transcript_11433/m.28408 type:complete len:271 (+) Transcript_11433:255-1067(+)